MRKRREPTQAPPAHDRRQPWRPSRETAEPLDSRLQSAREDARRHLAEIELIYDSAPIGLCVLDRELRFLRINTRLAAINGLPPAHHIGRTVREVLPMLADTVEPLLERVIETGEPILDIELHGETAAEPGVPRVWIASWLPMLEAGRVTRINAVTQEVTERRDAEARARTLAKVVETSSDFIGVADLDGHALYLNHAGQQLVGLPDETAVRATRVEDYLFPEDRRFLHRTVLPAVLEAGRWSGEFRFRHFTTGEPLAVHWGVVRIDDPETGRPVRLATVTRDIRPEKAAADALREASRRKDEILALLGHELRNPMGAIRNALEVLELTLGERSPRTEWALGVLERQTGHLSRLLDDLTDIARIVRGRLKLSLQPVELAEVITQAADGVRSLMAERGHRFETQLPPAGTLVHGDPVRLSQILLNLLLNAATYTGDSGNIRVGTRIGPEHAEISVRDDGPGIPPERLEDLFAPFARAGAPADEGANGLGLGLTISRRLAEMHGGRLEGSSAWPEPGSEFRLVLPLLHESPTRTKARPAPGPTRPAPADTPAASEGPRVLVVDDNADVAGALAMLLEVLGCTVETAASGAEALERARQGRPRLALLDIGLPDMDGLELARRLRAEQPDPTALRLVAISGYGHAEARLRSREAGFDLHLAKPVSPDELRALIAACRMPGEGADGGSAFVR